MAHPFESVKSLFAIHRLTSGRCLVIGDEVGRLAAELGDGPLSRAAERLVLRAETHDRIRTQRRVQTKAVGDGRASAVDRVLDNALGMMHGHLTGLLTALEGDPFHSFVDEVLAACFPEGLAAVVKVPFEDELIQVRRVSTYLRGLDDARLDRLGIRWHFGEIERLLPEYAEALAARRLVTAGDLSHAREEMHAALCALVAYVVATWFDEEAHPTRDRLLAPVFEQQARLSALMRARRLGRSSATPAEESDALDEAEALDDEALDAELDAAGDSANDDMTDGSDGADAAPDGGDDGPDTGPLRPIRLPVQ